MKKINMERSRFLVIYNYKELKNYKKNQSNLSFFIKHAMNKDNWKNLNVDYLFVIKNSTCEILFPILPNIFVFNYTEQSFDSRFDSWNEGIKFMCRQKNISKINENYDYIFFLNEEVSGPYIPANTDTHWLEPFYTKIQKENSIICSNVITYLPDTDLGGPGFRLSTYFFLLKLDDFVINILTTEKIRNVSEGSKKSIPIKENTVFGKKDNIIDSVLTGDYGISRVLLYNDYKLSCLLYDYDYYINETNLNDKKHPDRFRSYKGDNLPIPLMIFYKSVWIWENNRNCIPVDYESCKYYENHYCNYGYELIENIDYELLKCPERGITYDDTNFNWNNKEEFYKIHGIAEEILAFPIKKQENKSVAIYHHYDSDNIVKTYVTDSLICLMEAGYDIVFCTSCNEIKNVDLPFDILYYPNYGAGTDFIVYYEVLKDKIEEFKQKYDYLFITNDSVIFPTNGIEHFIKTVKKTRDKNCDFWGYWDSPEIQYHYVGTILEFKNNTFETFLNFLKLKIAGYDRIVRNKTYYINQVEVKLLEYVLNNGFTSCSVIKNDKYKYHLKGHASPFNPRCFYEWLKDEDCFAIKWKYMANYMKLSYFRNNYLNNSMKYLHFGPNGPKGNYEQVAKLNAETFVKKI